MDRRIVAGFVGLALVGPSGTASGQVRDPNSAGMVGYTPLDPVADRINNNPARPTAGSNVPTDPTESGPPARVPTPPVGPYPVALTPEPALAESIDEGYSNGPFGWFGRRNRAAATRKAQRTQPPASSRFDPATVPAGVAWDESGQNPTATQSTTAGRPAPFGGVLPDYPRPQALTAAEADDLGGGVGTGTGRAAPFRDEVPRQARPRIGGARQATPRLRLPGSAGDGPTTAPPAADPTPPVPSTLPDFAPATADQPTTQAPAVNPVREALPPVPMPPVPMPPGSGTASGSAPTTPRPETGPPALPEVAEPSPATPAGPTLEPLPPLAPSEPAPAAQPSPSPPGEAAAIAPTPIGTAATQLVAVPTADPVDPQLLRTSTRDQAAAADPTAIRIDKDRDKDRPFASARAAAVGNAVITVHQVETMVVERYKMLTDGQSVPKAERDEMLNTLAVMALDRLIDQSLVLQEARLKMKNPKMKQQFDDFADKQWRADKLPGLLQKNGTTNEYELRRKLADEGRSYAEMQENYRNDMLEHDFLYQQVKNKINTDLVKLKAYYNQHIHDFDQPARLSWREIEISVARYPDREAARREAGAALARLRKEDFAAVATAVSNGPTASQGGLYADMTPGNYGILPVNAVLGTIPLGTISPVIEAPDSFHIVRVESRRAAGPLRFDEVQRKVSDAVFREEFERARDGYLAKLRSRTLVRVMPMFEQAKAAQQRGERGDGPATPATDR